MLSKRELHSSSSQLSRMQSRLPEVFKSRPEYLMSTPTQERGGVPCRSPNAMECAKEAILESEADGSLGSHIPYFHIASASANHDSNFS